MTETDRKLALALGVMMVLTGIAGGIDHWNTPNGITRNISLLYLPCIAVWFGRRLENPIHAIGLPAALGLILMLPTLLIFTKHSRGEPLFILAVTVLLPAVIAAASRAIKTHMAARNDNMSVDALRAAAKRTRLFSLVGIILFPQLVQPALLDTALKLEAQGKKHDNDMQILAPAKMARIVSLIILGLIAASGVLSALAAMVDAIT